MQPLCSYFCTMIEAITFPTTVVRKKVIMKELYLMCIVACVIFALHTDAYFVPSPTFLRNTPQQATISDKADLSVSRLKYDILQLSAALDRGQSFNPTSGTQYSEKMAYAKEKIKDLISKSASLPKSLQEIDGEWELVFSSVPHGIFRSSPFFLAIQEAYSKAGQPEKAQLFFKLHELQTCSWGLSKIGKVSQIIDSKNGLFISEFDTSIFSLTVIPFVGWFKLLPTFGGTVVTVSKVNLTDDGILKLEVDYTTSKKIPGLNGVADFIWDQKVPVNQIWSLLPWNQGKPPTATIKIKYSDEDFRIMEDIDGETFVYTRPIYVQ